MARASVQNASPRLPTARPSWREIISFKNASRAASAWVASSQYAGVLAAMLSGFGPSSGLGAAALPALPGAAHVQAPRLIRSKVADERERQRQQWQADEQRLADACHPIEDGGQPLAEALLPEPGSRLREIAAGLHQHQLPKSPGQKVQRDDRERVGVERDQDGDREVHAECDRQQHARRELHRVAARDEPREQAHCDAARHRPAVQVPQVVVLQARPEPRDVAVLFDGFMAWQDAPEELAWHKCGCGAASSYYFLSHK